MTKLTIWCLVLVFGLSLSPALQVLAKCEQKNSNREANPDIYRCNNQMFEPGRKLRDPENCQCYYHCSYKQQPCYYCCPDGQVFHPTNGCVLSTAYQCRDKPSQFSCPTYGLFAHSHCRKYWDCRSDRLTPVEEACPEGHHWEDRSKVCRKDTEVTRHSACNAR